jgi:serine carboxypeptidase-like clade IV
MVTLHSQCYTNFAIASLFQLTRQNNMGFSETSLSVLLLFILFSSLYATSRITHHRHNPTSFSPNQRAEKLIRSLNLFPKDPVKMIHGHSVNFVPGKILEKKFSFFGHSDELSIENLSHHAGYYSLPHSKAAR